MGIVTTKAEFGISVYDADGNEHTIEHDGIAVHPRIEGWNIMRRE